MDCLWAASLVSYVKNGRASAFTAVGGAGGEKNISGFLPNRPLALQVDLTLIQDVLISTILGKIEDFEQSKLTGACYPLVDLVICF